MASFLIGVASSLAAMAIVFLIVRWRWPRVLATFSGSALFGHGVDYCYPSQKAAQQHMADQFRLSATVRVMCIRAFSMTQPERPFSFILEDRSKNIHLLLADPGDSLTDNPEIERAAKEYAKGTSPKSYRSSVQISLRAVKQAMQSNNNIKCRVHRLPRFIRMFLCEEFVFLSFFKPGEVGTAAPVLVIRHSSILYDALSRLFDFVWKEHSQDITQIKGL